jgi:hypothetical protein
MTDTKYRPENLMWKNKRVSEMTREELLEAHCHQAVLINQLLNRDKKND